MDVSLRVCTGDHPGWVVSVAKDKDLFLLVRLTRSNPCLKEGYFFIWD
jgi:hypothetical protein